MSKFKIGDKAVALKTHPWGYFKEGDIYIIDGFNCCPKCGVPCVYLKGINDRVTNVHSSCGWREESMVRPFFLESYFEKPISMADSVEYKLKVSIPELTEIKELQNQ